MTEPVIDEEFVAVARRTRRVIPALALVPVVVAAVVWLVVGAPGWLALALGAAGWLVALMARQPFALLAVKVAGRERAATIVGWLSGPAEELARLALVLVALSTVHAATWAGVGWGAIEVVFTIVNAVVISAIMTRTDAKSIEAREMMRDLGMTAPQAAGWGVLERVSAMMLHLGFTLMLFAEPWLVVLTIPLHSATNMAAVRFAKSHLAATELLLLALGAMVLGAGVILTITGASS